MEYVPHETEDMLIGKLHFYCTCSSYIAFLGFLWWYWLTRHF